MARQKPESMKTSKTKRQPATVATAEAKCHSDQRLVRQTFDDWWMDVIIIARLLGFKKKQRETLDKDAWRTGYYNEHFTAAEAWQCEYESA